MPNGNSFFFAAALSGTLSLLSPAHAESDIGNLDGDAGVRFKSEIMQMNLPSQAVTMDVVVGAELPAQGITFYEMPAAYGLPQYRYTVVNGRVVVVDGQRRVVRIR
jgi:Protein of unknown function (DUF1236)